MKWQSVKIFILCLLLSVLIGLHFSERAYSQAAFNRQINYQGKLTNASGVAVADGSYHMKFRLYTSSGGATTTNIWEEIKTATNDRVTVTNGVFSVLLGSTTPLSVNFNQTLYLGVEVGGSATNPVWDDEMSPRKKLGTVPAAFEAEHFGGLATTSFLRSDAANSTTSASTFLTITQNGAGNIAVFNGTGNVGIGTSSPYAKLSVWGSTAATGAKIFEIANSASTTALSVTDMGSVTLPGILTVSTTTATSTFSGGVNLAAFNLTGSATSTAANGINVTAGCFSIRGICVGAGNGNVTSVDASGGTTGFSFTGGPITTSGTLTLSGTLIGANGGTGTTTNRFGGLFYGDGSIFRQASSTGLLDYDPTLTRLTVSNASTTRFSALTKASFGSTATSSFDSAGVLSLASALTVPNGGSGAGTLTGLLIGNGTSAFTATTLSSGISGQLSDETGSGVLVFDTTPTFTTNITDPLLIGGTGAGSTLTLKSTSGSGTTDATIFQVGNNGAVEAGRITTAGEWGLGTTTPHRELVISDSAEPQLAFTDASPTSNIWEMRNAGGNLYFATSSAATQATSTMDAMRLQGGSTAFGIATTSPWRTLSVVGTMAITGPTNSNTGDYLCWNTTTFEVEQSATACSLSSIRWKENIREIDGGLMNILALHPILYDLKPEYGTAKDQPGFIAEEALKATPKLVSYGKDGQVSGYDYPKLTAYLTKAVQELNTKVENLSIGKITESAQDEWQWLVIGLLLMWNLALTLKRK